MPQSQHKKWNESGFRPLLCTYRLNWARRTSWRWWDEWDNTVLQTQDSKFKPWRAEAENVTSRSRRLTTSEFCEWMGNEHFCFFQTAETGKWTPNSSVKSSGANHHPRAPAPQHKALHSHTNNVKMGCTTDKSFPGRSSNVLHAACHTHLSERALADSIYVNVWNMASPRAPLSTSASTWSQCCANWHSIETTLDE